MKSNAIFNVARLAEKSGKTDLASSLYAKSAAAGAVECRAEALYRLANLRIRSGDATDVQQLLTEAIELRPGQAAWHYRLATVLDKHGDDGSALAHYRRAVELQPAKTAWKQRLDRCENRVRMAKARSDDERAKKLRRKGERWRELDVLQSSAHNFSKSPDWYLRLGDALEAMSRYREAAEAFARANELRPGRSENLFREGHCWKSAGFQEESEAAFHAAREADGKYHSRELGIGVFYERRGMWHEAAACFEAECDRNPLIAELQFRAGRALERCYLWKDAAVRYRQAAVLSLGEPRYHFRLGFSYERLEDFVAAEECYAYGIELLPHTDAVAKYWSYRLGVVRETQGNLEGAVTAYTASWSESPAVKDVPGVRPEQYLSEGPKYALELLTESKELALCSAEPDFILSVAHEFERRGMWREAAACLESAADRAHTFSPPIYLRLGKAYEQLGDLKAASNALRMTRISVAPRGIDPARYQKDKNLIALFEYREMMENLPVRDNVIVYESFFGKQISCNPYALFRELFSDPKYKDFLHVWSVTEETHIPRWMRHTRNIIFVRRGTYLSRRYLATAGYLVNNVTFPPFFIRRRGQRYLNTWHGTPMKTLGKDVMTGVLEHRNVSRNLLQATHIITPNQHTTRALLERSDVEGLATAKVGYNKYPRIDLTLGADDLTRKGILDTLGIPVDEDRKIVLYAPTWRGGKSEQHFDIDLLTSDLEALSELNCVVLFQGHHLSVALLPSDLPVTVVSEDVNVNELLSVVDILITDYSSILFDFVATGRPVICYTYDLEEYSATRGLYFTPKDVGLTEARSTGELIATVSAALSSPAEHSASPELASEFCAREDGRAAERVKKFFLEGDDQWRVQAPDTAKTRFLFHHSMLPNGISSSLINLLKSLDPEVADVTVVVPAGAIEKDEGRISALRDLPSYVKILADGGRQVVNIEEKWIIDYLNRWHVLPSPVQQELYLSAFRQEYRRLFGDSEFDVVVEFEGYSQYWTSVLAAAPDRAKKIIYLHSDMEAEWKMKFPYLRTVFDLYDSFDVLAAVSPALAEVNRNAMLALAAVDPGKFVALPNQIDPSRVRSGALEPLDDDLQSWFSMGVPTVLSIGRFSLEKDQAKLIRAMALVREEGYEANLVLLGEGPMRGDLEELVNDLGLQDRVFFAGHRKNPFPALREADCFVLSSNHEGQPMVLLESLILGTAIVATDIPGSRYVLSDNLECLVDNSEVGLAAGITEVLSGKRRTTASFDADEYWATTRDAFLQVAHYGS